MVREIEKNDLEGLLRFLRVKSFTSLRSQGIPVDS